MCKYTNERIRKSIPILDFMKIYDDIIKTYRFNISKLV